MRQPCSLTAGSHIINMAPVLAMLIMPQGRHMLCHRLGDHPIHALHTRRLANGQSPSMSGQFHL